MLLPDVEEGVVILVGATTENPFFTINSALVSRSRIFQFQPLSADDIKTLFRRAAGRHASAAWANTRCGCTTTPWSSWPRPATATPAGPSRPWRWACSPAASGRSSSPAQLAEESVQRKAVQYDREGDAHYDSISALIKSIRGSDPDAALYWLARMLEGGEDVRFLARRLVILASEDVGNADPAALAAGRGRGPGLRAGRACPSAS